jgi:hypothetical protein
VSGVEQIAARLKPKKKFTFRRTTTMKALALFVAGSMLTATAWANTFNMSTTLTDVSAHAQKVQRTAEEMSTLLKSKAVDRTVLEQRMEAVHQDVSRLKDLVATIEGSGLELTPAQQLNWQKLKTKVELLQVFANNKKDLLERGDLQKSRSFLRAHADGIAKRAAMLQQTAAKL